MDINKKERIILIIPVFEEEGKIGKVVSQALRGASLCIDEFLTVDDGSRDNTVGEAGACGATVIRHERNQGVGSAIRTGIDYALKNNYDIAVVISGDNQDDPRQIERLIAPLLKDGFDFVQGSRYLAGGKTINQPFFRWFTTRLYSLFFRAITGFPISDGTNGFRAFKLSIFKNKEINIWQSWLDRYELEPYLFYQVIACHFRVTEAPVTKSYPDNNLGYTKMTPLISWWSILRPLISLKLNLRK